jgi:RalA-binding protein 1
MHEKQKHAVKFPEKSLFNTLSPSKVDQRKIALERYLQQLILTPLDRISDICQFLSTDVIQQQQGDTVRAIWLLKPAYKCSLLIFATHSITIFQLGYKEGYLTKRGKNFGGWKRRYFVIQNHYLNYFDTVSPNICFETCKLQKRFGLLKAYFSC